MRTNWIAPAALAAAMVAGTALAGGVDDPGPPVRDRSGFCGDVDGLRPLHPTRGPFFGIRVNSMDLRAGARTVACFDYAAAGLLPGEEPQKYQLVRTIWSGKVQPSECDEILGVPLPPNPGVDYVARMATTRWVRDVGPNGRTPVGGFVGQLHIGVVKSGASEDDIGYAPVPLFEFRLLGTSGLRPAAQDITLPPSPTYARCSAPLHEEGSYMGGLDRRGLKLLADRFGDQEKAQEIFRTLANARIVGTFEGELEITPSPADEARLDFCDLSGGSWRYDGVMGWRAKRIASREPDERR